MNRKSDKDHRAPKEAVCAGVTDSMKGEMDHSRSGSLTAAAPVVASADLRKRAAAYLALASKATPGPWRYQRHDNDYAGVTEDVQALFSADEASPECWWTLATFALDPDNWQRKTGFDPANANFIAASHTAAQLIRDFLNALPETSGATDALAPTSQITPSAVSPAADLPELLP